MKVTEKIVTPIPPPRTFIVEMTEDEMFRLCALSRNYEAGENYFPYPHQGRLHEDVPLYIKAAESLYKRGTRNPFAPRRRSI